MAIFHFTVKIVGRSKGKSVISASAYLNGDVMKNEETGRISYYTSKKEVVYTSLMMCENAPPEWLHVPEENIKRFQQSIRYKRADDKGAALEKFKITFQKQRLWNEVLKIEKMQIHSLDAHLNFPCRKNGADRNRLIIQPNIFKRLIGIKIVGLYKKYCWDMITIRVILISMATAIYFGKWIKTTLPINLLFLLLFVQLVYVGIRWYVKGWRETSGYH